MDKYFDINQEGYSVRCKMYYQKDPREIQRVVIATHGFGGFKDNKSIEKFADRLLSKYKGFGVICFDWPCHGADARKKLRLEECMTYLGLVVKYAKEELQAQAVYNYSVSFGAYLTLKYIAEKENPFARIALRCPGIKMFEIMDASISEEEHQKLKRGKEITKGRDRLLKIDQEFLDQLKAGDISRYDYIDYAEELLIIQGSKDEYINPEDVIEFADKNIIELDLVEGANHTFQDQKKMDGAIHEIISFFKPEGEG